MVTGIYRRKGVITEKLTARRLFFLTIFRTGTNKLNLQKH